VLQRYRADRRDQWWKRTQWALDLVVSGEEDAVVLGLQVLEQQVAARTADAEDASFIAEVLEPLVDSYSGTDDTGAASSRDLSLDDVGEVEGDTDR
jgi:bisphosphoglycerate-independent phosphoglycerate mutase (AlkP superfamily)